MFLHGYLADKNSFAYQFSYFSRYFRVYAVDLKGFGDNIGMERPYSLDDYVSDVSGYIDKNGIRGTHVIAHSFGGRIVLKAAYNNPNLFDKIVLTGAAGLKPKRGIKYYCKRLAFKTLSAFTDKKNLQRFYSADYLALDPIMRESFKKIVGEYLDYTLCGIKNSALIINGEKDKETPPYTAYRLHAGIKESQLVIIKNAGHFAFIDSPLKFNTEVKEFLLSR